MSPAGPGLGGWSLRRRLFTALAVASVLLLTVVLTAGVLLLQVQRLQTRVVEDLFDAVEASNRLFVQLLESETAVRGFALTGQEDVLAPYERSPAERADGAAAYEGLVENLADKPELLTRLEASTRSAQAWSRGWAEPMVERVRAEGAAAVTPADIERGRRLFDTVRGDYGSYRDALLAERSDALAQLQLRTRTLGVVLLLSALGALLTGIALRMALRRWVTDPLESLAGETRTVSSGRLDHAVTVTGPPEVVALAGDVEAMRRGLLAQLGVLQAAKAEVERAHARLEEQAVDLARSNRELEQFAYVASHDLQEPLRKVASFCQMLERRYQGQLDERADQYIAFAVDGAKRMQRLINDLLAFSRVGRVSSGWAEVPLEQSLAAALRNLDTAREETGAEVTWDPLPVVRGDAGLLTQLFQNLVGNGIKFRAEAPPRVHIGVRRSGEEWELACSDNGIGIEPQYADRIFVIFQRLHPKDSYDGTGIGLALCKKIVEYHGGRIWLDAAAGPAAAGSGDPGSGHGTTFRWTLPVAAPVEQDPAPDVPAELAGHAAVRGGGPDA